MATIGERIRSVRKRRGLTQQGLADLAGVSASLIRKLEQDARRDVRLETLRKIAVALKVPTTSLMIRHHAEPADEQTLDLWGPVRRALYGLERPPLDAPTREGLGSALEASMPLWKQDRYSQIAAMLPVMLRDADALVEMDLSARHVRGRLLHLVGWLMTQTRQFDEAEFALSRAMDDMNDPLDAAATVSTHCWLLLRQGRLDEARQMATQWADDVEPRISRATPHQLSAWGWLLLRSSAAAIRDNRPDEADDTIRLARTAAVAMGRDLTPDEDFLRTFGPLTVAMKRVENAMIEDRPDKVLQLSQAIPVTDLRPTSNNRNRHLLDVAEAHRRMHRHSEAFDVLQGVRRDAPEWITNQRYARDILQGIIGKRRALTDDMRDLADFVRLEY
ncbi:helix-turn-helix domain-containing protein [Microbispora bryophytorum]|uniref:Helix-turn-helix transcriptional regulator n=1 Tax=Microbispora bryophytorum subsp. camponoti TaxID=1677852 RepID=A0ABR8KY11_9ACTN|nr:helix-turn-helix transcriptional regulator [Microbispora camponoti]MBD3143654.1 helix-turn-helix transcriptional regulator [Microbispora camponoti]